MIKQFLEFGFVIALVIILGSCEKAIIPPPQTNWGSYIGNWENVNAFAGNINRITISIRERGQFSVQVWGSCGVEECEWGLFSYSESDINEPTLPMNIIWNKQEFSLRLGITASGKMELKAMEGSSNALETQYFSWVQTGSFFQQIEQADARSLLLANTRINGSPGDPDNQLTSGNILIFQTNEGRLGKIQVRGNDHYLSLRWQIWAPDGTIHRSFDYYPFHRIGYYDLDQGKLDDSSDHRYSEFYWSLESQTIRWLEPLNGAGFALYHLE